jgi:Tol biopolymer transport system component
MNIDKRNRAMVFFVSIVTVFLLAFFTIQAAPKVITKTACNEIFYSIFGKTFFSDIYIMMPNGETKKISPTNNGTYYQPHISYQGDKVVFYGNEKGPPRIWIADVPDGTAEALTSENSGSRHAVFSWDGKKIAFSSDRSFNQPSEKIELMRGDGLPPDHLYINIFIMDCNGENVRQITWGRYQDQRPAFSPDGKTLAFVSDRGGRRGIWIVETDGRMDPTPLTEELSGYRPWFSTDGKWIYFFSSLNNGDRICRISPNGGEVYLFENNDATISHGPFVDYDNKTMLVHSRINWGFQIWELSIDGINKKQIILPGFEGRAAHPTRSANGILSFDVYRQTNTRRICSMIKGYFF